MSTFDFKKVSAIVAGSFITGFMDGSVIKSEKNEDNVIPHVGAGGDVTFSESNDDTGTITLTLKQTSASLPALIALANNKTEFAAQIIDQNDGKVRVGGSKCRILKAPSMEWGNEVAGVEIPIYVADYDVKNN